MAGETEESKLYDAALIGEEATFQQLLQQNPWLLKKVSFSCSNRTPLHVATLQGNAGIVENILRENRELSQELDSQGSSALNIAAARGHAEIASELLRAAPGMCWSRDCHGMNPVHAAAMNGHVEVLKILIDHDPFPAMEKVDRGQSVLQLCVKRRQIEALRYLMDKVRALVYEVDDDGETLLYSAVRFQQVEVVRLLAQKRLLHQLSTKNSKGKTILQISRERAQDTTSLEIETFLYPAAYSNLMKIRDNTMVVVVLIATMAFQATVSPPGGVWQDDDDSSSPPHRAGEAVMASQFPTVFESFKQVNAIAFASSFLTIFIISTGLQSRHMMFTSFVVGAMWLSIFYIAISYGVSAMMISPGMEADTVNVFIKTALVVFYILLSSVSIAAIASSLLLRRVRWWLEGTRDDPRFQTPVL